MSRRVLLCMSHSIEEHDQLLLLSGLGYEVASIGGYIDPSHPHDQKRPALSDVPAIPLIRESVDAFACEDNLGAAQKHIPDAVLEWLGSDGVICFHEYPQRLFGQWERLREWREAGGRIVLRTLGQSTANDEMTAAPYHEDGLEIVRYSPKERAIPGFAGEDALIRFWKDPDAWCGWTGEDEIVANVTQDMVARGQWCNYGFYQAATDGLPITCAGPGSENLRGGRGTVPFEEMLEMLQRSRCYVYTGTQPASLTLSLIEALMVGIPVVSIGPSHMRIFPYGPDLFEGHELAWRWSDDPRVVRERLAILLEDREYAAVASRAQRARAISIFGRDSVAKAWREYLGAP